MRPEFVYAHNSWVALGAFAYAKLASCSMVAIQFLAVLVEAWLPVGTQSTAFEWKKRLPRSSSRIADYQQATKILNTITCLIYLRHRLMGI